METLRELQREFPGAELMLIMGADQAAALPTWHAWEEVLQLATICLAERASAPDAPPAPPPAVPAGARTARLELPPTDASATHIRQLVAEGKGIDLLVPAPVARYIERHHLYQHA